MTTNEKSKKGNKRGLIIALALLLLTSIGVNIAQLLSNKQEIAAKDVAINDLSTQNDEVNQMLEDSKTLVSKLEGDVAEKDSEIQETLSEIERIKAENDSLIQSGMDAKQLNKRLRANLALVKKLNKKLEAKVDELLLENKKLENKNTELTADLDSVETLAESLNEKVKKASALQIANTEIDAFRKRNRKSNPWKKTSLARRTNKLEIAFEILDNEITDKGNKVVMLKIISPEGKTLGKLNQEGGDSEMQSNGSQTFAAMQTIDYQGVKEPVKMEFVTEESDLPEGDYLFEVFIDGESTYKESFKLN